MLLKVFPQMHKKKTKQKTKNSKKKKNLNLKALFHGWVWDKSTRERSISKPFSYIEHHHEYLTNCVSYSYCDISRQDFFGLMRDQNIQMKKRDDVLHIGKGSISRPFS
jgi:hypothetical protein